MTFARLVHRSLLYYWRTNLAVIAGVATAVAVLAGALLVGVSVRASLLNLVLRRLGTTDFTVTSPHFVRDQLAVDLAAAAPGAATCPMIHVRGVVSHESSGLRAHEVEVYGVDDRFWRFHDLEGRAGPRDREVLVGEPLARELLAAPGDTLLIRLESQERVPKESLFGRRADDGHTLRMSCSGVLPVQHLGDFSPSPGRQQVLAAFVGIGTLRRALAQGAVANVILVSTRHVVRGSPDLGAALRSSWNLADAGLRLSVAPNENAINVESPAILLSDALASAALRAAANARMPASAVYTYLANTVRCGAREIPYSVISAVDLGAGALSDVGKSADPAAGPVRESSDALWLNEWARDELKPAPGSAIEVSYFVWRDEGRLETESARFRYAGVVATGPKAGPSLAPVFPGITERGSIGDWDPPFPLDMRRIRPEDERYWNLYRTTPKAFIRLNRGRELWGTRFGNATAVRLAPAPGTSLDEATGLFREKLISSLSPELAGIEIRAVRERGVAAARGSTDFGEYFVYFSFFLIAAAVLLSAMFFRLGVEQRVREVGTLLAEGYTSAQIRRLFLHEAAVTGACGTVMGLPLAAGYAALLMHGLRTWWIGASGTTDLQVHVSWFPLLLGAAVGFIAAFAATATTLHTLGRGSPRALLSGTIESRGAHRARVRILRFTALTAALFAGAVMAAARLGVIPDVGAFFGAGLLLLVSALSATSLYFRRETPGARVRPGWGGLIALGIRNASHRPGRTLSCIALIASAIFVIASLEAFRRGPGIESIDRRSGTGGFPLLAESALPILADLNSAGGLESLGLQEADLRSLAGVRFVPFRLKPGDDTSCLSLYAPQEPRILGVPSQLSGSDRFSFRASLGPGTTNPWRLLETPLEDGAIPAVADANTIEYILHRSLGDDVPLRGGDGKPLRLRLVAALRDSIFQRELLISERNFVRCFPEQQGFRFFLVDAVPPRELQIVRLLEERLSDWGFDARSTADELASFHAVENTYLSTFQSLGGLGLILGTAGLAAVLLRNVLERRKELALMRAVGFPRVALAAVVVAENAALLVVGLLCGTGCALLAVSPALAVRTDPVPLVRLALLVASVFLAGLAASLLAVVAALRSPLLPALRSE